MKRSAFLIGMFLIGASSCARNLSHEELAVLTSGLKLGAGSVVADVGAGDGRVAWVLAREVGPSGRVYASELDANRRSALARRAETDHLGNLTVVVAEEAATGLDEGCCDAVLMRGVFHHLNEPQATLAGIAAALKPGGRLMVVDFRPSVLLAAWPAAKGLEGHGIGLDGVTKRVEEAGLGLLATVEPYPGLWPLSAYALVFEKREAP